MTADRKLSGGLDRFYFNLLRALPSANVEPIGIVAGDPASLPDPLSTVRSFGPLDTNLLHRWKRIRDCVPALVPKSDLIVSHFAPYAFPVIDYCARKPFVIHFQGPWSGESAMEGDAAWKVAIKARLERSVYARGKLLIVLTQAFGDILTRDFGIDPRIVRIIPGGVDLAQFSSSRPKHEIRERLGWPVDKRVLFTVRRLVRAKGIDNLVAAVERIREKVDDFELIVAGVGPLARELEETIATKGLSQHVRLIGHIAEADLPDAYRAADLLIVPTVALEGFGLVVVESLACGTPALVTPVGGLPEVVRDLSPDLILDGYTVDDLTRGIVAALDGTTALPSEAACRAYAQRFDWKTIARRVGDVYREALTM